VLKRQWIRWTRHRSSMPHHNASSKKRTCRQPSVDCPLRRAVSNAHLRLIVRTYPGGKIRSQLFAGFYSRACASPCADAGDLRELAVPVEVAIRGFRTLNPLITRGHPLDVPFKIGRSPPKFLRHLTTEAQCERFGNSACETHKSTSSRDSRSWRATRLLLRQYDTAFGPQPA
jgi:hypothetical protein